MKNFFADMKMYGRYALGLKDFLRHQMSLTEAEAIVRQRMAERDTNFMRLMEKGIFGYPKSPYRPLLELADCELGDIRNMVQTKGLEATLHELRQAGVYVTFEEYKGRKPVVRSGKVIHIEPQQFDNPYLSRHYHATTGGTTGPGTRVVIDLDFLAADAPHLMLEHHIHDTLKAPYAIWFGPLPDPAGISATLMFCRFGKVPQKWFSTLTQDLKPALKYRLANHGTIIAGRLFGVPIPRPQPVSQDQAAVIARWAAKMIATHGACLISTHTSQAMRICIAAFEEGVDFSNVTILGGGEPPSAAKLRVITRTGARWVPQYFFTEVGAVGLGCADPIDENDLHFLKDALALIQYPRRVPGSEITVEAFNYTTLLFSAPKLLLNVESDDYGISETRSCGCPFETYGYTEHLRKIRSFGKLTGEGVTLVGGEMLHILEEVLPSRFGGSPLDYQLLEEEDQQGFTRLSLLVSPKIQINNESDVIETVMEALKHSSVAAHLAGELWKQAQTLRVKRQEPIWTARGKFMPLHKDKLSRRETKDASS
jgi:hypothetical protein